MESTIEQGPPGSDLLHGIAPIAVELHCTERRARWLWESGQLPFAFKWGKVICARRSKIRAHIEALENGGGTDV